MKVLFFAWPMLLLSAAGAMAAPMLLMSRMPRSCTRPKVTARMPTPCPAGRSRQAPAAVAVHWAVGVRTAP